jgi:hypothetical protein
VYREPVGSVVGGLREVVTAIKAQPIYGGGGRVFTYSNRDEDYELIYWVQSHKPTAELISQWDARWEAKPRKLEPIFRAFETP